MSTTNVVSKRARALAASIADDGTQRLPQRKFFRQRAHINPMSHQLYEYPIAPSRALWSRHFPLFAAPSDPAALVPGLGVRVMDVGCGFGGLTMALAERAPDTLVLGLEIRPKVTEYVRLRIQAHRRKGMEALGSGGSGSGSAITQPHPSSSHHNASVLKSNAMKYLPCLTPKASLTQLFFCFADPQFKPANHRRRIVNTQLLAEYAYALREGGRLYFITDVPDLFNWMEAHTAAHPLFARLSPGEEASDPAVALMWDATEESQKVAREGRRESVQSAVWRRVSDEEGKEREAALKKGGGWWDDVPIDYTYTPSAGQLSKGKSRDWRGVIASGPEVAAEDFAKAQAAAAETKAVSSRSARRAAAAAATAAAAAVAAAAAAAAPAVTAGGGGLVLPFGKTVTAAPEGEPPLPPGAFFAPSSRRNAGPIEGELRRILSAAFPSGANVLELACGSGQHAAHFVTNLGGGLVKSWQPTDKEESGCASANAYREALAPEHKALLLPAHALDIEVWGGSGSGEGGVASTSTTHSTTGKYDCVLAVNVLHISPLATTTGVLRGAAQALAPGGVLVIYGPFTRNGEFTTPSNKDFDGQLKELSPAFGLRDLDAHVFLPGVPLGLVKEEVVDMPANNFLLVLRKQKA